MKKAIAILAIVVLLVSVIAVSIDTEPEKEYYVKVIPKIGQPELIPLSNKIFDHIEVTEWDYTSVPSEKLINEFYPTTEDNDKKYDAQIIYYDNYHYDILQKGKENILRIFVPPTFYQDNQKINTNSIKMRVYYKPIVPAFKTSSYEPQWAPVDYLVITTETFWSTVNDNFKDWKKANDEKITEPIEIVNISTIVNTSYCWINGTYGDATNTSGGNPWIADGEEIHSHYDMFNDTQSKIRNYIRRFADHWQTKYVLLVGNKDVVPPRMICSYAWSGSAWFNDYSHASDMYYSCLHKCMNNNTNSYWMENKCRDKEWDDIDWGYDLCVGRVLVNTVPQLNLWINKTKAYTLGQYQGNYLRNHICACKDSSNDISDQNWLAIGDEFVANQTFLNNQNISQAQWNILDNYVNGDETGWGGFQFIYHTGHGGTLYDPYRGSNCHNSNTPEFVYTEGCHTGDFGADTSSRMENWIHDNGCAFAGIANSAYGWFVASTYYGEEMFNQMFNETTGNFIRCFCQAHNDAREIVGHPPDSVFGMIVKETNFFGDPAMEHHWYQDEPPQIININGNGNRTTIYNSTPTFKWTLALNTSEYWLQISTDSNFTNLAVNLTNVSEVTFPSYYSADATFAYFTLPTEYELGYSKTYYCRVRANEKGVL